MATMTEIIKKLFKDTLMEALKEYNGTDVDPETKKKKEIDEVIAQDPQILTKKQIIEPEHSKILVANPSRFIKIGTYSTYCKDIKWTVFCNLEDFKKESYTLGTNSPYPVVYKDKMRGIRGVALPYPIDRNLVASIVTKSGFIKSFYQVDVGPGYVDDPYWVTGTNPKNESGIDFRGNRSVKAGIDFLPQVLEDLDIMSFEEAYLHSPSGVLDVIIFDPPNTSQKKTGGMEIPTKETREWVHELPETGSEFFSWRELLRGWNRNERPSEKQIQNIRTLVKELLHPMRVAFGRLRVNSCLRDVDTNKRVGGRTKSLHIEGRAADLTPLDVTHEKVYSETQKMIKPKIRELLWEYPNDSGEHIHVGGPIVDGETQNIRIKKRE